MVSHTRAVLSREAGQQPAAVARRKGDAQHAVLRGRQATCSAAPSLVLTMRTSSSPPAVASQLAVGRDGHGMDVGCRARSPAAVSRVFGSQRWALPSSPAVTNQCPSGAKATELTVPLGGEVDALPAKSLKIAPFPIAQIVFAVARHAGGQQALGRVEGVLFDLGRGHADAGDVGGVFFALLGAARLCASSILALFSASMAIDFLLALFLFGLLGLGLGGAGQPLLPALALASAAIALFFCSTSCLCARSASCSACSAAILS